MKKLLIILSFLLCFIASSGQTFVQRTSGSVTPVDQRLKAGLTFYIPVANDTTLNGGLDSLGAFLYVKTQQAVYFRDTILTGGRKWVKLLKFGDASLTLANNGLSKSGDTIQLGGSLIKPTTITSAAAANTLTISGPTTFAEGALLDVIASGNAGIAVRGETTNGRGIFGLTTTGVGVYGDATGSGGYGVFAGSLAGNAIYAQSISGMALEALIQPSSTNTVVPVSSWTRTSSSAGTNGIGGSFNFNIKTSTVDIQSHQLIFKLTNATNASATSSWEFWNLNNATLSRKLEIAGNGQLTLDGYPSLTPQTDTTNIKPLGYNTTTGLMQPMANWIGGGGGSGNTNSNIGSGFRLAVPNTNNIKTLFTDATLSLDSTTNANALTLKGDTTVLATQYDLTHALSLDHSFIQHYYADTATADQTNVGISSSVRLSDGSWFIAYTGFGSNPEDGGSSSIWALNSYDNYRTFANKRSIVPVDTVEAYFFPSVVNIGGDTLIMIWGSQIASVNFGYVGDIRMRKSTDGGATWGVISIIKAAAATYYNIMANRILRTASGKLIYPYEQLRAGSMDPNSSRGYDGHYLESTDNGATWTTASHTFTATDSSGIETGFFQRPDNRLVWYGRSSKQNWVHYSYSDNDGSTWTAIDNMNLPNPNSTVTIRYLPKLDIYAAFTNQVFGSTAQIQRKYINVWVSSDGFSYMRVSAIDTSLGPTSQLVATADVIDLDSSIAITYSEYKPNTWGYFKVARIPNSYFTTSVTEVSGGFTIPSGNTASRPPTSINNLRFNTDNVWYEGNIGSVYAPIMQTGTGFTPSYPFDGITLQSTGNIRSWAFHMTDADASRYNRFDFLRQNGGSWNPASGFNMGGITWNTMTGFYGKSTGVSAGGFSTVDITVRSINAANSEGERFRFTGEGTLKINTASTAADIENRKLYVNGSIGANKDSIPLISDLSSCYIIVQDSSGGQFKRVATSGFGGGDTTALYLPFVAYPGAGSDPDTIGIAGLTTLGTAGQMLRMNSGATGFEYFSTLSVANGGTGQTTFTNGQLLIGNTTGNTLTKATLTAGTGISITNGTGSITLAIDGSYLSSNTYNPTITNGANVAAASVQGSVFYYTVIGNQFHVWGTLSIDPTTTSTLTVLDIELPITSSISSVYEITGRTQAKNTTQNEAGWIEGNSVGGTAKLTFFALSAAATDHVVDFWGLITPP